MNHPNCGAQEPASNPAPCAPEAHGPDQAMRDRALLLNDLKWRIYWRDQLGPQAIASDTFAFQGAAPGLLQ